MFIKCFAKKNVILFITIIIICIIVISFIFSSKKQTDYNTESDILNNTYCSDIDKELEEQKYLIEQYTNKKLLAITFDDGPSKYTKNLVDELSARKVSATFFLIGQNIEKFGDMVDYINSSGSEIAIHSYVHKLFTRSTNEEIINQISLTRDAILSNTDTQIKLIRVPYGSTSNRVNQVIESENLTSVLWDVDSLDWKLRNTQKVYNYVLKNIKGNQIILMHDIYKTSVEAALKLIDTLQENCYTFVTVSKFLEIESLVNDNKQVG